MKVHYFFKQKKYINKLGSYVLVTIKSTISLLKEIFSKNTLKIVILSRISGCATMENGYNRWHETWIVYNTRRS